LSLEVPDQEHVESLRKSVMAVGYIRPILVNEKDTDDVLGGKHRIVADKNWPKHLRKVESELDRDLIILHDNVQRTIPEEQTKHRLLRIARTLSTTGGMVNGKMVEPVKPEDVCKRLTDPDHPLVPFGQQHVAKLLPDEYKHMEHSVRTKKESFERIGVQIPREDLSKKQQELLDVFADKPTITVEEAAKKEDFGLAQVTLPSPVCICPTCKGYHECYG